MSPPPASDDVPRRRRRAPSARQIEETTANRRAILLRAVEFFARNGYEKTTLQAVAEDVGLTRTGLLHHFTSKESLFLQAIDECRRWAELQARDADSLRGLAGLRALSGFLGGPEDAMWVRFAHTLRAEALHIDASEPLTRFVNTRSTNIQLRLEAQLRQALEDGDIKDVDVPTMAKTVLAVINGLQMQWLLDPDFDTAAAFDAFLDALSRVPEADRG